MKNEDKTFARFVFVSQCIGIVFLLIAVYIYIYGIPVWPATRDAHAVFCQNQGGLYIEPYRGDGDLCEFTWTDPENNTWGSMYGMIEVVNEFPGSTLKKGDLCFVCWSGIDCEVDTLTKKDNNTRRDTRC